MTPFIGRPLRIFLIRKKATPNSTIEIITKRYFAFMKKKTGSTAFISGSEKSEESFAVAVTTKANMQKQRQARTIKFLNFPIFGAEKAETSNPFSPTELLII